LLASSLAKYITQSAPSFFKQISFADSLFIYGTFSDSHGLEAALFTSSSFVSLNTNVSE